VIALLLMLALADDPPALSAPVPSDPPMPCELGFEELKKALASAPGIRHAPYPRPNAFDTHYDDSHGTIYFETTAGQPADPAIVRVVVAKVNGSTVVIPSACVFGDKSRTEALFDAVKTLMDPTAPGSAAPARPQ